MKRSIALLVGTALVLGVMAVPATAVTIAPTSLNFTVTDKTPNFKTEVTFTATLKASRKACYASRPVKLYRNGELIRSKQTNDSGVVKWKITIRANGKWKTKFRGREFPHPRDLICQASTSKVIKIEVQNKT
jgi:hypothetical protein